MKLQDLTGIVTDYSPVNLKLKKYQLPNYIVDENGVENFEAEEVLAMVIEYSRQAGEWIPVEQRKFDENVQKSYFEYQERCRKIAENKERVWELRRAKFFYYLMVFITFGFYGKNEPTPSIDLYGDFPMKDVEDMALFERTLVDFHTAFKNAYSFLRSNGYLHAKTENYVLYIYPSDKVLEDVRKFTLPASFYTKKGLSINYRELTENLRLPFSLSGKRSVNL